jgi:hypothetical protein
MHWAQRLVVADTDNGRQRRWYGIVGEVVGKGASLNFSLPHCAVDEINGDKVGQRGGGGVLTLAVCGGLEELSFQLCCYVSFWF